MEEDGTRRPLGAGDVNALQFIATQTAVDFALYGVQVTLSTTAIAILARRHGRSRFTLAAILGLLSFSTVSTVANLVFYLLQLPLYSNAYISSSGVLQDRLNVLISVAREFSYIFSDIVLVWRTWCLWQDSRLAKGLLTFCAIGTVAGPVAECAWIFWPGLYIRGAPESNFQELIWFIPLLATNVVATVLIGAKFLYYRREIKDSLGLFSQRMQAGTILLLLLESGVVYILFCIMDYVLWNVTAGQPLSPVTIVASIGHHIAGIYPTCVLFIAVRGTAESLISTHVSQAMRFAGSTVAQEEKCEASIASDYQSEHIHSACDTEPHDMGVDNLPSLSIARSGEVTSKSSEDVVEIEREMIYGVGHGPLNCLHPDKATEV